MAIANSTEVVIQSSGKLLALALVDGGIKVTRQGIATFETIDAQIGGDHAQE